MISPSDSHTIAALRDALMLKLLSGKLCLPAEALALAGVPDAAKLVEAHA